MPPSTTKSEMVKILFSLLPHKALIKGIVLTNIPKHSHIQTPVCMYTHTHTCVHTHTHIHTSVCTHTHTHLSCAHCAHTHNSVHAHTHTKQEEEMLRSVTFKMVTLLWPWPYWKWVKLAKPDRFYYCAVSNILFKQHLKKYQFKSLWRPPTPTIYVSVPLCSIISVQVTIQSFNLTGWELVKKTILESFFFFFLFSFTVTMKSHPNQITANIHLPAHSTHCDQLTFCMTSSLMPASSMGCCAASGPASAAYAWKQAQSQLIHRHT